MEEPLQREPAVRAVPYPENLAAFARRLGAEAGWCWLDGGFDSEDSAAPSWSYLGVAAKTCSAERGQEPAFLEMLRGDKSAIGGSGFFGGWVVALGYEFGVALMGIEPHPDDEAPAFALRLDVVLAVNHGERRAELRGPDLAVLDAWWRRYGTDASGAAASAGAIDVSEGGPGGDPDSSVRHCGRWRQSNSAYAGQVDACKEHICNGDAYVLCLTDTVTVQGAETDPLALYERLRASGGATRGAVIVTGERALVSASPERFLSVSGGIVSTNPIKGTRPRGRDPESDVKLAEELAADPKERSENLMIVDLMRNDLSRVCVPGSVRVDGFLRVETHPHVHQLVSTVAGVLQAGVSVADVIAATFPGGSMTGAPKHRSVEILAALEQAPRGLYSGCFGWLDDRGDAELAMTIRSVELRGRSREPGVWEARVGAGGGITADSEPDAELREKHLKAAPLLAALRAIAR